MMIKRYIIMLLALTMFISTPVFADEIPITPSEQGTIKSLFEQVEKDVEYKTGWTSDSKIQVASKDKNEETGNKETILEYKDGYLTFNPDAFKKANKKQAENALKVFISNLKDSTLPLDVQQEIMTSIQESDSDVAAFMIPLIFDESKADLYTAYKWLYPFLKVLRVVFGIGSIAIVLLLIASTIMDMVYIGLPVWRNSQSDKGNKHPFGVSYEALKTVNEIEKSLGENGYQNAYLLYFKRRALTYVVLAICLLYLIVGELGGLVSWILSLASGVVN